MARKDGKDRGLIEKPKGSGKWFVRLCVASREKLYRCDSKTQAKALYGRLKADVREEKYFPEKFAPKQDVTLAAWIRVCLEGSTNPGAVNDRRYGRRWSLWFGKRLLAQLSVEELRRHQSKLRSKMKVNRKTKLPQRQWKDSTINRHFAYLRHVLMLAMKDGKLLQNPVSSIKFFPEQNNTRFLTDPELRQLAQHMAPEHWQLVLFAVETGLRREEQFQLRWDQVDLENRVITIPMSKSGKTRHIPLTRSAQAMLRSLDSFTRSPWVFPAPKNPLRPWNPQSFVNNLYNPALRKAGIVGSCWHSLRHTAASRRVMAGVDIPSVMQLMGHRNVSTTMRYSHLSPEHLHAAVNRGSLGDFQIGTGTTTGTKSDDRIQVLEDKHVFSDSSQFKNPKSKHAPIVRFLDKEHPHC